MLRVLLRMLRVLLRIHEPTCAHARTCTRARRCRAPCPGRSCPSRRAACARRRACGPCTGRSGPSRTCGARAPPKPSPRPGACGGHARAARTCACMRPWACSTRRGRVCGVPQTHTRTCVARSWSGAMAALTFANGPEERPFMAPHASGEGKRARALEAWGAPDTTAAVQAVFSRYYRGEIAVLPWCVGGRRVHFHSLSACPQQLPMLQHIGTRLGTMQLVSTTPAPAAGLSRASSTRRWRACAAGCWTWRRRCGTQCARLTVARLSSQPTYFPSCCCYLTTRREFHLHLAPGARAGAAAHQCAAARQRGAQRPREPGVGAGRGVS